jgi:DNA polymerase-1
MRLGVNKEWIPIKQDTGNPVLDKFVMKDLAEKHKVDFVVKIQEFKKYEKLLGTYLNGIYSQHDAEDMVHCGINTMEAVTGRMSITKPALQTLPKKDKTIRNAFIPKKGHKFWFLDLDQVEYRMFAHYAQAVGLIEAIKKGYDIHQATAALIYKVPYEEVTEDMRTMAKRINFALIYGMGDPALAETLELSLGEAMKFKAQYFAALPEAQPFINSVQRVCKTRGWIKNKYGRRRRLKREEVYKAVNSLIQGCAADYIKEKAVLIMKYILLHKLPIDPVLPIHDEIIYDVPDGYEEEMYTIRWIQSEFTKFRAPITAGVEIASDRWGKKVEPEDGRFNALTDEQLEEVKNYNIYNGDIFDRCM